MQIYIIQNWYLLQRIFFSSSNEHTDRDLIFEEKRQKALEKKLGCKFIRINTSNAKNCYDLDYKVGNVQAFIDEFKNKKIKEEKEIREKLEIKNEKLKMRNEKLKMRNEKSKNKNKELKKLTNG